MTVTLERTKRVYTIGPMSSKPNLNAPAFEKAAKELRSAGYEVVSPWEMDVERGSVIVERWKNGKVRSAVSSPGFDYEAVLAIDLQVIETVDCVALLPGWEKSPGGLRELSKAISLGLEIIVL